MGKNADEYQTNERKKWRVDVLALANKELAFQNEEKDKAAQELALANKELAFQNEEKDKRADELTLANEEKEKRAGELVIANKELAFQNEEKDKRAEELILAKDEKEQRADELVIANEELAFQNQEKDNRANELILAKEEKEKRADELAVANKELAFQNEEKDKRAEELILAKEEKEKRADELVVANNELAFQNEEKDKRADELALANQELAFQNEEKDKRAEELVLANEEKDKRAEELVYANEEKDKRAEELILANEEKDKRAKELIIANQELAFQNEEKDKRAEELALANKELAFQNEEKDKRAGELILAKEDKEQRADELVVANAELAFQNEEKDKRAEELVLANEEKDKRAEELVYANEEKDKRAEELILANEEKDKRAKELIIANQELAFQNEEKDKRAEELALANKELAFQNEEKDKRAGELILAKEDKEQRADELVIANAELAFQNEEKDKRAEELALANEEKNKTARELILAKEEKGKWAQELDRANEELAFQNELTQFVDTANAPIFGIDARGRVNEWNQQSEQITGFTKQEVMGQDLVANFIADDYKVSVAEVLAKALQGEETANYEFPLFTQMGARVDVLLNSTTRRDASGIIVGVVGVGQDITELNKVRVDQANIAKELTQFIDTANAPIFGIDAQGKVNEWNQQSEQITGFTKREVMGQDLVANFIADDYKVSVGEVLAKALKGEETANYEFPLFTQSGARVDVLLNSTTRRDASGLIAGVVGVGQDITELNKVRVEQEKERKEASAQIIHASKLATLGEMATSVAHELNQPLNVIRMAAGNSRRRMAKGSADTEYLTDKLERIEGQTARAAAIIEHMRMFGRKAEEHSEAVDPRAVVTNALDLMGEQLRLSGIEIVTDFRENCPFVLGHPIQMEQVILNLLTNASDAMAGKPGAARITLSVFEDERGVRITSEDTGGGIPEDVITRIFEPFYTTKEMGKGTGLGLSVSYGIVRDMSGSIIAENIQDGARFTIMLPVIK